MERLGFHGSNQIPTPNIDALAYNGIILNSHYVQSAGTPSRTALFTGKYPMRLDLQYNDSFARELHTTNIVPMYEVERSYPIYEVCKLSNETGNVAPDLATLRRQDLEGRRFPFILGMHGPSLIPTEKRTLPEGKLMPEYFKDIGYSTHLVGKWNLGYAAWNQTPTFRGFDRHFGFYNAFTSYYDYLSTWKLNDVDYTGFDLRRDGVPVFEEAGKYATDAFTDYSVSTILNHDITKPLLLMFSHLAVHAANEGKALEAPQEEINKLRHIEDANRRTYAAMVTKLDESVGAIVEALENKNMLQNTIIVFISDNGAPTLGPNFHNWGSNYPLRGMKDTLFEGGVRGTAFVFSPLLIQSARVSNDLIHISDWLPTLYTAAGGDIGLLDPDLDGIDQWSSLVYELPSPRNDILINIDEKTRNAALRFYNWKLIVGTSLNGSYNEYYGDIVMGTIEEPTYNTTSVFDSPAGRSIRKVNYTPLTELEYEVLRRSATLRCLAPKAKRNPCDPASTNCRNPVGVQDQLEGAVVVSLLYKV
ncbi:hypothetical protein NQ318_004662 [Aromia moschata]|uniref:Sulfatase N-terminal domain-containing protein n=1 Tax=Aromia moschata TaxID=1265417 RepID=A0AAV8Y541_9CUCU|nr:hypothetical protein NQ318_004662 [Aromia moschata]